MCANIQHLWHAQAQSVGGGSSSTASHAAAWAAAGGPYSTPRSGEAQTSGSTIYSSAGAMNRAPPRPPALDHLTASAAPAAALAAAARYGGEPQGVSHVPQTPVVGASAGVPNHWGHTTASTMTACRASSNASYGDSLAGPIGGGQMSRVEGGSGAWLPSGSGGDGSQGKQSLTDSMGGPGGSGGVMVAGTATSMGPQSGSGERAEGSSGMAKSPANPGGPGGSGSSGGRGGDRMQNIQSLLQMRSEMAVLRELKLGPLLGRGSYGRVHRAKWKSAIVAVKIIEHHGDGSKVSSTGKRVNVGREGVLSTTMSHPNVVQTYHISTMSVGQRAALTKRLVSNRESAREQMTLPEQVRGAVGLLKGSYSRGPCVSSPLGKRSHNGHKTQVWHM